MWKRWAMTGRMDGDDKWLGHIIIPHTSTWRSQHPSLSQIDTKTMTVADQGAASVGETSNGVALMFRRRYKSRSQGQKAQFDWVGVH